MHSHQERNHIFQLPLQLGCGMVNCGDRYNFWVMILKGTCCTHHYLSVPIFYRWDKEMLVKVRTAIWNHKMKVYTAKHPNGRQLGPQHQEAVLPVLDHWWRILHERQWYFYLASVYCILESVYDSCLICNLMNGTIICLESKALSRWLGHHSEASIWQQGAQLINSSFLYSLFASCQMAAVLSRKNNNLHLLSWVHAEAWSFFLL